MAGMRVGRCATVGDKAEGNRCDASDDPEGHPEGVVEEEGVATKEWHRIGVREAGPWSRAPCPKTPRPNGAAICWPGATAVPPPPNAMNPERAAQPRHRGGNPGWARLWKVRTWPALRPRSWASMRGSKSALASSSGASTKMASALGQALASRSGHVRHACGQRGPGEACGWTRYLRAVL